MGSLLQHLRMFIPERDINLHPVVSLRNRYLFFPISKVANSSIKFALRSMEADGIDYKIDDPHERLHAPLLTPYQCGDEFFEDQVLRGPFFRFAFVRNPYTRLLSCYLDRIAGRSMTRARRIFHRTTGIPLHEVPTFECFIREICKQESIKQNDHWRDQWSYLGRDLIKFDFVGRFERLSDDMAVISEKVFGDAAALNVGFNKSPQQTNAGSQITRYFNDEIAAMIVDRYSQDFDRFGYSRDLDAIK